MQPGNISGELSVGPAEYVNRRDRRVEDESRENSRCDSIGTRCFSGGCHRSQRGARRAPGRRDRGRSLRGDGRFGSVRRPVPSQRTTPRVPGGRRVDGDRNPRPFDAHFHARAMAGARASGLGLRGTSSAIRWPTQQRGRDHASGHRPPHQPPPRWRARSRRRS